MNTWKSLQSAKIWDYDENTDPEEHLARFENVAMIHCYEYRIKWKTFLITLMESAQRWFEKLELIASTISKTSGAFPCILSVASINIKDCLYYIWGKADRYESLRAYIYRFNKSTLYIPSCTLEIKTTTFTQGLREGDSFGLCWKTFLETLRICCPKQKVYQYGEISETEERNYEEWEMRHGRKDTWPEKERKPSGAFLLVYTIEGLGRPD